MYKVMTDKICLNVANELLKLENIVKDIVQVISTEQFMQADDMGVFASLRLKSFWDKHPRNDGIELQLLSSLWLMSEATHAIKVARALIVDLSETEQK